MTKFTAKIGLSTEDRDAIVEKVKTQSIDTITAEATAEATAQLKDWIVQQGYITNADFEEALGKEY